MAVKDPYAVPALLQGLENEQTRQVRVMYIEVLANIGTPDALNALAECSMADRDEEIWLTCLDYLEGKKTPALTAFYVAKLRSKDNRLVNRAAVALKLLKDPTSVGPLIAALVTVHKFRIKGKGSGSMSPSFGSDGSMGLSAGGGGDKIISQPMKNRDVLAALVLLADGPNLSYNQTAWKAWHASTRRYQDISARRD